MRVEILSLTLVSGAIDKKPTAIRLQTSPVGTDNAYPATSS